MSRVLCIIHDGTHHLKGVPPANTAQQASHSASVRALLQAASQQQRLRALTMLCTYLLIEVAHHQGC